MKKSNDTFVAPKFRRSGETLKTSFVLDDTKMFTDDEINFIYNSSKKIEFSEKSRKKSIF